MEPGQVEKVLADFSTLQHYEITKGNIPNGSWFVLTASPLPPNEELQLVIADIENKDILVNITRDGVVRHSKQCTALRHDLASRLRKVAERLLNKTFRIAVWEGRHSVLQGQPVVFALEPEITFNIYPDHPHLNQGRHLQYTQFYLPDSLCYTNKPEDLGDDPYTRVREAIIEVCIWLFRHQVWLETRKDGDGIWIGSAEPSPDRYVISPYLNPMNPCHCGSNRPYFNCHLKEDISRFPGEVPAKHNLSYHLCRWWPQNVGIPQLNSLQLIRAALLNN